jgi:flagellar motor protein MotB
VSSARLQAVGRDETEPIAVNDTERGRQLNRRVEVAIYANAQARKQ